MADLTTAFGSPFKNSCSLKFDIAPIFDSALPAPRGPREGMTPVVTPNWIGIVSFEAMVGKMTEFSYEVFSTAEDTAAFPQPTKKVVTRGTVTDSNNPTFTFPITSFRTLEAGENYPDYFVLVKPKYENPCASPSGSKGMVIEETIQLDAASTKCNKLQGGDLRRILDEPKHIPVKEEFAIFYTTRIMKRRNDMMKQWKASVESVQTSFRPNRGDVFNQFRTRAEDRENVKYKKAFIPTAENVNAANEVEQEIKERETVRQPKFSNAYTDKMIPLPKREDIETMAKVQEDIRRLEKVGPPKSFFEIAKRPIMLGRETVLREDANEDPVSWSNIVDTVIPEEDNMIQVIPEDNKIPAVVRASNFKFEFPEHVSDVNWTWPKWGDMQKDFEEWKESNPTKPVIRQECVNRYADFDPQTIAVAPPAKDKEEADE